MNYDNLFVFQLFDSVWEYFLFIVVIILNALILLMSLLALYLLLRFIITGISLIIDCCEYKRHYGTFFPDRINYDNPEIVYGELPPWSEEYKK